jgi:hypothetical protein
MDMMDMMEGIHEVYVGYRPPTKRRGLDEKGNRIEVEGYFGPRVIKTCLLLDDAGNVLVKAFAFLGKPGKLSGKEVARNRAFFALGAREALPGSVRDCPLRVASDRQRGAITSSRWFKTILKCGERGEHFFFKMVVHPTGASLTDKEIRAVEVWRRKNLKVECACVQTG